MMHLVCCDLEGVFVPEIWINVSKKTGIEELKYTTRDIPDYDVLMKQRLSILEKHGLKLSDIQQVISTLEPLEGAKEFLEWIKERTRVIVVSDTFVEFADPLMKKLGRPTLLCHSLTIDSQGNIRDYNLRQPDPKRRVVEAFQNLKYHVIAFGDSYNDVTMLQQADNGILFKPPKNVVEDYPQFPVTENFEELKTELDKHLV